MIGVTDFIFCWPLVNASREATVREKIRHSHYDVLFLLLSI